MTCPRREVSFHGNGTSRCKADEATQSTPSVPAAERGSAAAAAAVVAGRGGEGRGRGSYKGEEGSELSLGTFWNVPRACFTIPRVCLAVHQCSARNKWCVGSATAAPPRPARGELQPRVTALEVSNCPPAFCQGEKPRTPIRCQETGRDGH